MALPRPDLVEKQLHHEQLELCTSRAQYRQGRKLTAVRVYTVNDESKYLIVNGVPAVKLSSELEILCQRYGDTEYVILLPDYPHEDYVEVYLVKYRVLKNGRFAKRQLDGKSFYGQVLHVCYAPELETVEETREKLQERRKSIAALTRHHQHPSSLSLAQRKGLMPPATMRYMKQLRPDLRKETLDVLHPRVADPATANPGVSQEEQKGGGSEGNSQGVSYVSEGNSQGVSYVSEGNSQGVSYVSEGNAQGVSYVSEGNSQGVSYVSEVCSGMSIVDEIPAEVPNKSVDCENMGEIKASGPILKACQNVTVTRNKRLHEVSTLMTTKKIKLFGKKNLLSYKQD